MTDVTPQEILDLPLPPNDSGATTIRGYLTALLTELWREEEGFSSKRPFGNSGWQYDLYSPLIRVGAVPGSLDPDGYVEYIDDEMASELVLTAISALGIKS